jgi:serine phosphatase RsbU (regulator of sigma subunit)
VRRLCLTLVLLLSVVSAASAAEVVALDAQAIRSGQRVKLPDTWRYRPAGAAEWTAGDPGFPGFREPSGWAGSGRFEIDLQIPEELVGRPLALLGRLTGAARVTFGGREIGQWGELEPYRGTTNPTPLPFTAIAPGIQTLSIDYVNPEVARYRRAGWAAGFSFQVGDAGQAVAVDSERVRLRSAQMWGFTAFFLGFAALHFLLARFSDERRGNLDFAIVCLCAAGLAKLLLIKELIHTPEWTWFTEPAMNVVGVSFALSGLWWVYGLFRERRPRRLLGAMALVAVAVAGWGALEPRAGVNAVFLFMLGAFFEMTREAVVGVVRRRSGAVSLAVGIVTLSIGFAIGLLTNLGYLPRSRVLNMVVPFSSMVVLILCASFSLSRRLGEYARKSREIEEARALQLSMLPRELPRVAGFELAGCMDAATEVGGDYYDASSAADGSLVVAIGDATGHGAKAGTLVTAMKGVFGALRATPSGSDALQTSNEAFLRMGLRPMAMALTWVSFDPAEGERSRVRIAVAGTPPPVLVRGATGETESLALGALPLGLLRQARYVEIEASLGFGDVLVLFTDGFPEGLGKGDAGQLGYERATEWVAAAVREESSAEGIVAHLRQAARAWRGGGAPDDDVTFFVVRRQSR